MITTREAACNILGVSLYADESEIKTSYRKLIRIYHPDAGETADAARYAQVMEAYEYLCAHPIPSVSSGAKVIGGQTTRRYQDNNYATFDKRYQKKKQQRMQEIDEWNKNYHEKKKREQEQYDKAMEAIRAIRAAQLIKHMLDNNPDK